MANYQKKIPKRRARGKWMRKGFGNQTKSPVDYGMKKPTKAMRQRQARNEEPLL